MGWWTWEEEDGYCIVIMGVAGCWVREGTVQFGDGDGKVSRGVGGGWWTARR